MYWVCKPLIGISIAAVFLVRSHRSYAKAGGWTEGAVSLWRHGRTVDHQSENCEWLGSDSSTCFAIFFLPGAQLCNYGQLSDSAKMQSKASVLWPSYAALHPPAPMMQNHGLWFAGMDNEAINSKKGTKWKPGDDLTLQIEGHALPSCRQIEQMVNTH